MAMQLPPAGAANNANDSNLTLLRMTNSDVLADPHVFYRILREKDPVHWDPYLHAWVVTSYPEVVAVLKNYSADRTPQPAYLDNLGLSLMKPFAEDHAAADDVYGRRHARASARDLRGRVYAT